MSNENKYVSGKISDGRKNSLMREGASHYRAKRYRQALEAYTKAIELDSSDVAAYVGKGDSLRKLRKYEEALVNYEKTIELDPKNIIAYNGIGQILRRQQRYQEALEAYNKGIEIDPEKTPLYFNRGNVYYKLEEYVQALRQYRHATKLDPQLAEAYLQQGRTLCKLEEYEEAILAYQEVLRINPEDSSAHREKAEVLSHLEELKGTLDTYERVLRLDPKLVSAYMSEGHAPLKLRRYEEARHEKFKGILDTYEQVLRLDPKLVFIHIGKGHALLELKRYEEALQAYEQALQLNTQFVSAHIGRGDVLFQLQRYEESLTTYKQTIKLDKKNIAAYLRMGDIRAALNQDENAIDAYEIALWLTEDEQNPDRLWFFAYALQSPHRPAHIQFELFRQFLVHAPSDSRTNLAFESIGKLYNKLFDASHVSADVLCANVQALHTLLIHLSEEKRAEALTLIASRNDIRIACLLIHLAPYSLPGLASLAHQVTLRWVTAPGSDGLGIRFYHVLNSYGVPFEDSDWLFAQELIVEGLYIQVKSVLSDLVRQQPTPDRLWLLTTAMWHRKDPVRDQIVTLHQFIASTVPSDARCGEAWKRIGELSDENAIDAYEIALRLIEDEQDLDRLWFLVNTLQGPRCPAHVQFELFRRFLVRAPSDPRINLAFESIGKLYEKLFDTNNVPSDALCRNIQALQGLLIHLPEEKREEALLLVSRQKDGYTAYLLIHLAPATLSGLTSLASCISRRWDHITYSDDLAALFYQVLPVYQVPQEVADLFLAQHLQQSAEGLNDVIE